MSEPQPKRNNPPLSMPTEVAKEHLRNDPDTIALAKGLGVELEAYIEQVMYFAQNPDVDPELVVLADEDIEAIIGEPSEDFDRRLMAWLEDVAKNGLSPGQIAEAAMDEFGVNREDAERVAAFVKAGGAELVRRAPKVGKPTGKILVDSSAKGSALQSQLLSQKMTMRAGPQGISNKAVGDGHSRSR